MMTAHADVVGSLLRPSWLLEARERRATEKITAAELEAVEDRAVDAAVALQEQVGLEGVTDGEMRRLSFQAQMVEAVDGFGAWDMDAFLWGGWHGDAVVGDRAVERPGDLGVVDKLVRRRYLSAAEFAYLRERTTRTAKVTLPSPSLWANFWSADRSRAAYPTLDSFLADVVDILRQEVAELVRLGATYIQLDAPHYTAMLEPETRSFYEGQGWPLDRWLSRGIELDNAVIAGFPQITFGLHLCRGNQDSRWLNRGGYDAIAGPIFRGSGAQRLLLEYDDERSGSFEPLREVPEDKTVVLGLITTKSPRQETTEELVARVREAGRQIAVDRLALSPQCGFSTSVLGNRITVEDQRRKLQLLVDAARQIWG